MECSATLESWQSHSVDFPGLADLTSKLMDEMTEKDVESARLFDSFYKGARLYRLDLLMTDISIISFVESAQEAVLTKVRFNCCKVRQASF